MNGAYVHIHSPGMAVYAPNTTPPSDAPIIANPWLRWGIMFGVYTLITLFFYSQSIVGYTTRSLPIPWVPVFINELTYWYLWMLFTPLILWFARRNRIERTSWQRGITAHLLLVLVLGPLHDILWRILGPWLSSGISFTEALQALPSTWPRIVVGSFTAFYKYWLIIGIYYTFDYYRKYRLNEQAAASLQLKTAQLENQLTQAQLSALKMQLHPHFLFNTLNTISMLMNEDVAKANRMLLRLGDLLRVSLESPGEQVVPLRQELAFLQHYLEIEQIRFEDRLHVEIDVSPDVLDALVPNMILQPLVENAIRHGIARKAHTGALTLRGYSHADQLVLQVQDNGPGLDEPFSSLGGNGIGLTNTKARLVQLYGDAHRFELRNAEDEGAVAHLSLPLQTHTSQPNATTDQPRPVVR